MEKVVEILEQKTRSMLLSYQVEKIRFCLGYLNGKDLNKKFLDLVK